MDRNDGGFASWPLLVLILGLIGGVTTSQFSGRAAGPAQGPSAAGAAPAATTPAPPGPTALLAGLLDLGAPAQADGAPPESIDGLFARARTAADKRHISFEFLIATLPDYVDSNSGWIFDASLDAVQRAAGAAGYVLDRFYLPDWAPTADDGSDQAMGRQHEIEPGLVLFRDVDEDTAATRVLAVFIVAETPTAGIHEAAFLNAARIVTAWHQARNEPYELRVLGPAFSGSSLSVRRAIETFLDGAPARPYQVRLLSGTATRRANQQLLTFTWSRPDDARGAPGTVPVCFAATVRADDVMLQTLHDHLVEINPKWRDGEGIVLLVESNTGYGQGFAARQDAGTQPGEDPGPGADPFPKALRIPFPIHISRLRAEAQRAPAAESRPTGTGPGAMLADVGTATDQLPPMTPQVTAATIETLVASILDTIRREEYPAIGIFATDKRDHLFLAERIVREVPNALLFTTEADLIYVHPSFRSFVRGAIIASSYPLFNATQSMTSPRLASLGRQQFSTMGAQGTYNAVLKLLDRDDLLLDYQAPECLAPNASTDPAYASRCLVPPVWISVAGRDGLWPIDSHLDDETMTRLEKVRYTDTARVSPDAGDNAAASGGQHPGESGAAHALLHVATWMKAAFVVLLLALLAHLIAYVAGLNSDKDGSAARWTSPSRWVPTRLLREPVVHLTKQTRYLPGARLLHVGGKDEQSLEREHRLFLLVGFTTLWFASLWAMRLFTIWLDRAPILFPVDVAHGQTTNGAVVWYLLYGGILAILVVESALAILDRRAIVRKGWATGALVTVVALFLAFHAGLHLAAFIGSEVWSNPVDARLLFARTVNPGNWVSPAAPVLGVLGVLYLWTLWNIRQLLSGGWQQQRTSALFLLLTGRDPHLTDEVADMMASPWRRQDWRCLTIPFGLVLLFALYVPTWYTPDGLNFDRFLWWGSLLMVFLIAHSLAMTVHLWLLVRRILRHLFAHPIAAAFPRVAKEPFDWRLSLAPPHAIELKPMARKVRALRLELRRIIAEFAGVGPSEAAGGRVERRRASADQPLPLADAVAGGDPADVAGTVAGALEVRRQDVMPLAATIGVELPDALDMETRHGSAGPYFKSETWQTLVKLSDGLIPVLRHGFWHRGSATTRPALDGWYGNAEALVGMQAAFVLRDLLARLVSGMTVTIVGAMLALTSHLFYSFPGRSAMLAFDWILLALAAAAATAMLMRLEKDPILNGLWSKTTGRLIWTGGFVYRLAIYVAIPIVTLFAWQFPEIGGVLFSWMEPLQRAIP